MSTQSKTLESDCTIQQGCAAVELIIEPRPHDLGGFTVRRSLPVRERRSVGPWLFFDEMGAAEFAAGSGINVRPHPHINLATVTYLFEGEIFHRDSLGSEQPITPGDINLMVAGKGIVHSERERPEVTNRDHRLHGLQLWMALPEADEEIDPAFYHYPSAHIPATTINNVPVRVLIGSAYGVASPVKTFYQTLYIEAELQAGQSLQLPDSPERGLYVLSGQIQLQDSQVNAHQLVVLSAAEGVMITASEPSRIALIGGESIGKRYMEWNFVSSRKDRIEQAKQDWQQGRFEKVPGDEKEFIPFPAT
ncbi:pirin family protein [Alkalimonas collagenimarina]|uniref:Pirin family protein n=1 Tax=Alkalimonas collagenimarina TaxID=400390 RepID=A0ABT9GZ62_9GAMM|nr:pirin family protein [Alkalimonas collagenimarina]MDP4536308.1 pirin family protein [Alkalimonas collagenimarina]